MARGMQCTLGSNRQMNMLDIPIKIVSAFEQMNYYVHAMILCTVLADLVQIEILCEPVKH